MENNQSPQQETTPNQFRKFCTDIFVNEILEELKPFEEERKKVKKKYLQNIAINFILILFTTIFIIYLCSRIPPDDVKMGICPAMGIICGISLIAFPFIYIITSRIITEPKYFEHGIKIEVMPKIFDKIPNFEWTNTNDGIIPLIIIKVFRLIGHFNAKDNDESFWGNYKNTKISIDECILKRDENDDWYVAPFKGVLILLETDHKLTNEPVIIKADGLRNGLNKLYKKIDNIFCFKKSLNLYPDLQKINLEDVKFEKKYDVYCEDQIEARYLLTTAFMERLNNIKFAFNADSIEVSVISNKMLIAVHTHRDLFKVTNIHKPIYSFNQYKTMVEEFASILEMIDTLKINRNIGL